VATNPWGYGTGAIYLDGVMINTATLPGGSYGGYNLGNNAVHEVGEFSKIYLFCNALFLNIVQFGSTALLPNSSCGGCNLGNNAVHEVVARQK